MNPPENRWNPAARPVDPQADSTQLTPESQEGDQIGHCDGAAGDSEHRAQDATDSPKEPEISPPTSARLRQARGIELQAILGADTALQGSFSFAGRVRIDGQVEGTVRGGDILIVGEGARITGTLQARRVIVLGGNVEADIAASESIELYIPAVVRGDLKSPQVYMDRGIQFHGTCDMTLDPPAVELEPEDGEFD